MFEVFKKCFDFSFEKDLHKDENPKYEIHVQEYCQREYEEHYEGKRKGARPEDDGRVIFTELEFKDYIENEWVSSEEYEQAIKGNSFYRVQVYPRTAGSFYSINCFLLKSGAEYLENILLKRERPFFEDEKERIFAEHEADSDDPLKELQENLKKLEIALREEECSLKT